MAEVNKTSNIIVTPEIRKQGRAVKSIRFLIKENPQLAILDLDNGEGMRNAPVYDRLRRMGVSDHLARQWVREHGEDYVAEKLDYVSEQGMCAIGLDTFVRPCRRTMVAPQRRHRLST